MKCGHSGNSYKLHRKVDKMTQLQKVIIYIYGLNFKTDHSPHHLKYELLKEKIIQEKKELIISKTKKLTYSNYKSQI